MIRPERGEGSGGDGSRITSQQSRQDSQWFAAAVQGILLHASSAAETLVEEARRLDADLIVMATRSRNVLGKMVFGSTAEHVLRSGVAPVLMVHPVEQPGPPPLSELPLGTYVFSSDGRELGQFTARNGDELEVTEKDGRRTWISQGDVAYLEAGRLVLKLPAGEIARAGRREGQSEGR